jgi:hypothetical protein
MGDHFPKQRIAIPPGNQLPGFLAMKKVRKIRNYKKIKLYSKVAS